MRFHRIFENSSAHTCTRETRGCGRIGLNDMGNAKGTLDNTTLNNTELQKRRKRKKWK
jgi:hypothetical protein